MGYTELVLGKKTIVLGLIMLLVCQTGVSHAHVFLSFRGTDTRETFASLIYDALIREGINAFMDDESMRTGQDIELTIREAINNSMGAVIIFSKDFASSEWCLDELIRILKRKRELGSDYVLAVVYVDGLKPYDIYDQRGSYGKALAKHKNKCWPWQSNCKKEVEKWRVALQQVAGYRGRILSGKWANFVNEVVKEIRQEFSILEIMMNQSSPPYPAKMDIFIKKMYQNWPLLAIIMFSLFVGQQPHQFVRPLLGHMRLLPNER